MVLHTRLYYAPAVYPAASCSHKMYIVFVELNIFHFNCKWIHIIQRSALARSDYIFIPKYLLHYIIRRSSIPRVHRRIIIIMRIYNINLYIYYSTHDVRVRTFRTDRGKDILSPVTPKRDTRVHIDAMCFGRAIKWTKKKKCNPIPEGALISHTYIHILCTYL